jgi:hypothetical protein
VLVAAVMSRSVLVPKMSSEAPGLVRELSMPTWSRTLRGVVLGASSAFEDGRCAWTQDRLKAARARVRVHDEGMSGVAERGTPGGDERHVSLQMRTLGGAFMPPCHHAQSEGEGYVATQQAKLHSNVPSSCRAGIQTRLRYSVTSPEASLVVVDDERQGSNSLSRCLRGLVDLPHHLIAIRLGSIASSAWCR